MDVGLEIRVAMLKAGVTQAAIARALRVSHTVVNDVIHGRKTSRRVREAIMEALGWHQWPVIQAGKNQ